MKKFNFSKGKNDKHCDTYVPNVKNLGLGGKSRAPEVVKHKKKKSFAEALQK